MDSHILQMKLKIEFAWIFHQDASYAPGCIGMNDTHEHIISPLGELVVMVHIYSITMIWMQVLWSTRVSSVPNTEEFEEDKTYETIWTFHFINLGMILKFRKDWVTCMLQYRYVYTIIHTTRCEIAGHRSWHFLDKNTICQGIFTFIWMRL